MMKRLRNAKQGLAKEELVILVILVVSFLFLTVFLIFLSNESDDASKELACRLSVLQRAALKDPIGGTSLGGFFCKTLERDVGKRQEAQKEEVMYNLAEESMKCWNMFGEGVLSTLKDSSDFWAGVYSRIDIFGITENKAYCFVCFEVDVYDIKDTNGKTTNITKGDFTNYLGSTVYIAEAKPLEDCSNGEDDDGDGLIDCEDEADCDEPRPGQCIVSRTNIQNPCIAQGGYCQDSCAYGTVEHVEPEWSCNGENEVCCVDRNKVYTYADYIYYHGGNGGQIAILDYEDGMLFEPGENYAITYVEPLDGGKKDSYIMLGKYQDIAQYCETK